MPRHPAPAKGRQQPVELDRREQIIATAKERILNGDKLLDIANDNGIGVATLKLWLHALGDEYKALRQTWLDNMLSDAATKIDESDDPLSLARAREQWRYATWYAERRDPSRYGVKGDGSGATAHITVLVSRDGAMIDVTPTVDRITGPRDDS